MSEAYRKPLPRRTRINAPFFEGLERGELLLQEDPTTGALHFPPALYYPQRLGTEPKWRKASGKGRIWSFVVMHQRYIDAFAQDLPYNVIFVELDEGVFMMSTLVDGNDALAIDAPVEVVFDRVADGVVLPKFKLAGASA
jgi:uncharacterized OB-fold protein